MHYASALRSFLPGGGPIYWRRKAGACSGNSIASLRNGVREWTGSAGSDAARTWLRSAVGTQRPKTRSGGRRKAIFVHGCFWHRHGGCRFAYQPKSRVSFWADKFAGTVARDLRSVAALAAGGWDVLIIWECESHDIMVLRERIISFMGLDADERTGRWGARTVCDSEKA